MRMMMITEIMKVFVMFSATITTIMPETQHLYLCKVFTTTANENSLVVGIAWVVRP